MELSNKVLAIIWDFDGTIADTWQKNFNVTKNIIKNILGANPENYRVLNSLDAYHSAHTKAVNWRKFYRDSFNMNDDQVDEAGRLWTEYQMNDQTPVRLLDGVENTISALNIFPHGIVSQNSRDSIIRYLKQKNIFKYFQSVVGYEEVPIAKQKPYPDGLLICLDRLIASQPGYVFYIGDHETDAQCVMNANNVLRESKGGIEILSVGAFYGFDIDTSGWGVLPDFEITQAEKLQDIIKNFQTNSSLI
jgi:HAD superfamily hydrolase (TIGR01549 family)